MTATTDNDNADVVHVGRLTISRTSQFALLNGGKIFFTPKERAIMWFLAKGEHMTRATSETIQRFTITEGTLKVFIADLRRKTACEGKWFVETIRGYGYKLNEHDAPLRRGSPMARASTSGNDLDQPDEQRRFNIRAALIGHLETTRPVLVPDVEVYVRLCMGEHLTEDERPFSSLPPETQTRLRAVAAHAIEDRGLERKPLRF